MFKEGVAPWSLQRFLDSTKWDHDEVLRRCRQTIASEQSNPQAIGVIDEIGTAKAGKGTIGVNRQYNGSRGKVENAVVSVALPFATTMFQNLIATHP